MAELSEEISLFHVASVCCPAVIGFTMPPLIATLAFDEVALVEAAGRPFRRIPAVGHDGVRYPVAGGESRTGKPLNHRTVPFIYSH